MLTYVAKTSPKLTPPPSFVNTCHKDWIPLFVNNPAFPHKTLIMPPPPPDALQLNKERKRPLQDPKEFNGLYGLHNTQLFHPRWVPYIRGVFKNTCLVVQNRS